MRTAVIYTGQTRTFSHVWANHVFHVLNQVPNPTIFASVADDEQADDMLILRRQDFTLHFEKVIQPTIDEPSALCKWHSGYPLIVPPQSVLRQLWALNRGWQFFLETADFQDYDIIIRIRPDICFCRCKLPDFGNPSWQPSSLETPWWARWGGINDRFAVMGKFSASVYFTTFTARHELWDKLCPLHTETMINYHLEEAGLHPSHSLAAEFLTIRMDGKIIPISASNVDVAEYARLKS